MMTPNARSKMMADSFVWCLNVSTTIVIIFVTKALMHTYSFNFATTICALHFLVSGGAVQLATSLGYIPRAKIPFRYRALFAVIGGISIASANLSLLLNSVGFYQIAKLLLAPFVCFLEVMWLGKRFTTPLLLSIAAVLSGVAIVTVTGRSSSYAVVWHC